MSIEVIGEQVDRLESLIAGLKLPLPPQMHIDQLKEILPEIVEKIKAAYINTTGENPWE